MDVGNLVLGTVVFACVFVCIYDVELSRVSRKLFTRRQRYRRISIWLPMGLTYALFYATRYNIVAGNVPSVRDTLGFTAANFGSVFTSGFWTYAFTAPATGLLADVFGAKESLIAGCIGASLSNLYLGYYFQQTVTPSLFVFGLAYSSNILFQGLGTAAIVKMNARLYEPEERGVFSGIFNVLLTSGYYFALGQCPSIVENMGWPYVFYIPGVGLAVLVVVLFVLLPSQRTTQAQSAQAGVEPVNKRSPIKRLFLDNRKFVFYLIAIMASSWVRDGLLTWMYSFFAEERGGPLDTESNALLGGSVTIGGFVGGIVVGLVSDVFFQRRRLPPIILFSILQFLCLVGLYVMKDEPVPLLALFVFLICVFLLGNYTILSYTIPTDLPQDVVGVACGIMTAFGYVASGFSGVILGTTISEYGYFLGWYSSLLGATVIGMVCVTIASSLKPDVDVEEEATIKTETSPLVVSPRERFASSFVVFGGNEFIPVQTIRTKVKHAGIQDENLMSRMYSPNFHQFEDPGGVSERLSWRLGNLETSEHGFFSHRANDPTSYFGNNKNGENKNVFPY